MKGKDIEYDSRKRNKDMVTFNFMISIVLPTFNEENSPCFKMILKELERASCNNSIEVIVIDGGSTDKTKDFVQNFHFIFETLPHSTRAARLAAGRKIASQDIILFHHPRSLISAESIVELTNHVKIGQWGGFTHSFDQQGIMFRFTSWYSNQIRLKRSGIVYLDHCIFFHRDLMNHLEIKDVAIFEDTLISYHLRKKVAPLLLPYKSKTSAIRFQTNGFWKQALLNMKAKLKFYLSKNYDKIDKEYEKGLNLNR